MYPKASPSRFGAVLVSVVVFGNCAHGGCAYALGRGYDVTMENPHREKQLEIIQGLYDANAREQGMSVEARLEHRQKCTLPILDVIKK
jgi:hypothetical protein